MAKMKDFFEEKTGVVKNLLLQFRLKDEDMKDDFEEGSELRKIILIHIIFKSMI